MVRPHGPLHRHFVNATHTKFRKMVKKMKKILFLSVVVGAPHENIASVMFGPPLLCTNRPMCMEARDPKISSLFQINKKHVGGRERRLGEHGERMRERGRGKRGEEAGETKKEKRENSDGPYTP